MGSGARRGEAESALGTDHEEVVGGGNKDAEGSATRETAESVGGATALRGGSSIEADGEALEIASDTTRPAGGNEGILEDADGVQMGFDGEVHDGEGDILALRMEEAERAGLELANGKLKVLSQ